MRSLRLASRFSFVALVLASASAAFAQAPPPVIWEISTEADLRAAAAQAIQDDQAGGLYRPVHVFNLHNDLHLATGLALPASANVQTNGFNLSGPIFGDPNVGGGGQADPRIRQVGAGSLTVEHVANHIGSISGIDMKVSVDTGLQYSSGSTAFDLRAEPPPPPSDPVGSMFGPNTAAVVGTRPTGALGTLDIFRESRLTALHGFQGDQSTLTLYADLTTDTHGFDIDLRGGQVAGTGTLTKRGDGRLVLSALSARGRTAVGGGTLQIQNDFSGLVDNGMDKTLLLEGGTLQAGNDLTIFRPISLSIIRSQIDTNGFTVVVDGNIAGAALIKVGAGTLILRHANTYTSGTEVLGGTLQANSDAALGGADLPGPLWSRLFVDGGTFQAGGSFEMNRVFAPGDHGATIDTNGYTLSLRAVAGNGAITKISSGTLILEDNTYFNPFYYGGWSVLGGTLQANSDAALGSSSGSLFINGATFRAGGSFATTRAISFGASGATLDTNGYALSVGALTGSGSLKKIGGGTLVVTGASTYAGATRIAAGTLRLSGAGALPGHTALTVDGGATFDVNGSHTAIGSLEGSGAVALGSGALTVGANDASTTFAGVISGAGSVTKTGAGTLTLTGANAYTGGTTIEAGALVGSSASLQGAIANNASLVFAQDTAGTFAGSISGTGAVTKSGSGTLTLTGGNSYTGGTTLAAGELRGDTSSLQGAIANSGLVTFAQASDGTFSNVISGAGGLLKIGDATLTLQPAQTYTGLTHVGAGTLDEDGGLAGNVLVDAGATLVANGPIAGTVVSNGTVTGGGSGSNGPHRQTTAAPASGMSVGGDLVLGPTATLRMTGAAAAPINVAGRATIAGATLRVDGFSSAQPRATTAAVLIARGGLDGGFAQVDATGPIDAILTRRGGTALVTLERTDIPLASLAASATGRSVGAALDAARPSASGDLLAAIREIVALPDAQSAQALGDISGQSYATAARVALLDAQHAMRAVADRLVEIHDGDAVGSLIASAAPSRTGASAAAPPRSSRPRFWFRSVNQGMALHEVQSSARVDGALLGADATVAARWTIGGFGGYDAASINATDDAMRVSDKRYRFGGYVTRTGDRFYVDGGVAGAFHTLDGSRRVAFTAMLDPALGGGALFGGVDRSATAGAHGFETAAFVESGLLTEIGGNRIQALAGVIASHWGRDAFTERGAGALSLEAAAASVASARATTGLRVSHRFSPATGHSWTPHAEARYFQELLDPQSAFTAAFVDAPGSTFRVDSAAFGRRGVSTSLGLATAFGGHLVLSGEYNVLLETGERAHAISFGLGF